MLYNIKSDAPSLAQSSRPICRILSFVNINLKRIIEKAKKQQVPADIINRAIEKAKGNIILDGFPRNVSQAEELEKQGDKEKPLVVLGIGGSKHTAEFLLNMNGEGNTGKVLLQVK